MASVTYCYPFRSRGAVAILLTSLVRCSANWSTTTARHGTRKFWSCVEAWDHGEVKSSKQHTHKSHKDGSNNFTSETSMDIPKTQTLRLDRNTKNLFDKGGFLVGLMTHPFASQMGYVLYMFEENMLLHSLNHDCLMDTKTWRSQHHTHSNKQDFSGRIFLNAPIP